ncbi:hypothetical protein CR513_33457, partial [Mucuna pruriens]
MKRYLRIVNNLHLGIDKVRRKLSPITFTNQNFMGADLEQNNPMVIIVEVANFTVKKLQNLESEIRPYHKYLIGFLSE